MKRGQAVSGTDRVSLPRGFTPDDFDIFHLPGFEERMARIRDDLRPLLKDWANFLANHLGEQLGLDLHPHVATHARRRVNPAHDTWLSLGPSPRGYKRYVHLAVGIEAVGLYARVIIKDDADDKLQFARRLAEDTADLARQWQNRMTPEFYWFDAPSDRGRMTSVRLADLDAEDWQRIAEDLLQRKSSGVEVGGALSREDHKVGVPDLLLPWLESTFAHLADFYRLAL